MSCQTPLEKVIELIDAGKNIFITGGGGVGKSYILNKLKEHYGDTLDITSTTGVSAINVGGQTIHSWAGIGLARKSVNYVVNYKIRKNKSLERQIKECKLLAIDEVSIMSDKLIKYLDDVLQQVRECPLPFGGLQVILIGDFFQLPPTKNKENLDADYCFNSFTWQKLNLSTIYLKEVKRQSDKPYIDALNNIRTGVFNKKDIQIFENRNFPSSTRIDKNILQLFPTNKEASTYNNICLEELSTNPVSYNATDTFYRYDLVDNKCNEALDIVYPQNCTKESLEITDLSDDFDNTEKYLIMTFNNQCNAPQTLTLKEGCRVMLLKNLNFEKHLVNGSCGQVTKLTKYDIEVLFDNGTKTKIEPVKFEYVLEGKIKVKRLQYPLMLAYAITNHKSQGMTFDKLVVNFQKIFGDGMGYVVLSRTRSLEGLYLKGFDCKKIQTSQKVIQFYRDLENSPNCYIFGDTDYKKPEIPIEENPIPENNFGEEEPESFEPEIEEIRTELDEDPEDLEENKQDSDRIAALEAQVLELKTMLERLTKSQTKEININNEATEKYIKTLDNDTNYFVKGFGAYNQQNYDEALELFEKCIQNEPNNSNAYFYIGCIWEIKENYEKAIENYYAALKIEPKNITYLSRLADVHFEIDEHEKALEEWAQLAELDPEYEIDYFRKALAEWGKKDPNYVQAIVDCNIFMNKKPDNYNCSFVYSLRGNCKYYLERYEDALEDYNKAIEMGEEESASDYNFRAKVYYQLDEYENAINDLNKALELDPNCNIDYFEKARSEFKLERYAESIDDYTKYLSEYPDDPAAYNNRGRNKFNLEDYKGAVEDLNKAVELCPEKVLYLNNRAEAFYWNDEYENALKDWNKVLELDPEYINYEYYYMAYSKNELGEYEDALSLVEKYLDLNPDSENAQDLKNTINESLEQEEDTIEEDERLSEYLEKAIKHYENEEYQEAIDTWNEILEIDPEYDIDYFDKARAEYQIEQYSESIDDYTKYISMYPDSGSAYNNRGLCKYKLENYAEAIKDYTKAIKLIPSKTLYFSNRAEAYYWIDEYKKALKDWNKALKLDPEYDINYYYKAYTENELGLYEDALSSVEKYLTENPDSEDALDFKNTIYENLNRD